jgi:hypothetical protein
VQPPWASTQGQRRGFAGCSRWIPESREKFEMENQALPEMFDDYKV